ncbi:MAG: cytochrome bd oxidase small subunit CydS [Escherichia sp.]
MAWFLITIAPFLIIAGR